jgi:hypothetical protein
MVPKKTILLSYKVPCMFHPIIIKISLRNLELTLYDGKHYQFSLTHQELFTLLLFVFSANLTLFRRE